MYIKKGLAKVSFKTSLPPYRCMQALPHKKGRVKVLSFFYFLLSQGVIPPPPPSAEPLRPSAPPCQHQHTLIPLENKCLLRTGAGAHLQPAPVEPHEALGLRPGGSGQEGAGGLQQRVGWGGERSVFLEGSGVRASG